jgi:geranylgeranyl pyrophosphate synthase
MAIALDPEVKRVFQKECPTEEEIANSLERVRRLGVLPEVQEMAHAYGRQALSALEQLPPSPYADSLSFFIHQLIDRTA